MVIHHALIFQESGNIHHAKFKVLARRNVIGYHVISVSEKPIYFFRRLIHRNNQSVDITRKPRSVKFVIALISQGGRRSH